MSNRTSLAKTAFIVTVLWAVSAVALWFVRGWQIPFAHSILPPVTEPELPIAQFRAIIAALLINGAALGWGLMAARFLPLLHETTNARPAEKFAILLLAGHVVIALMVFSVGIMQLLPLGLVLPMSGLLLLPLKYDLMRSISCGIREQLIGFTKRSSPVERLAVTIACVAFGLTFLYALVPVVESDGLRYHLFAPQEYLKAGGIVSLPFHAFTNLPAQTNMLFVLGAWVGDLRAAQLIHWTYLSLAFVCARWIARLCGIDRGGSTLAALVVVTAPVMLSIAGWPFVDLSTLAFTLASIAALSTASQANSESLRHAFFAAGFFAGAAIGTKLTALVAGFFTGLVVLVFAWVYGRPMQRLGLFLVPLVIVSCPWFLKNSLLQGNPVYPAGHSIFGGKEWDEATDRFYKSKAAEKGFGKSSMDLVLSPLDVTIRWSNTRGGFEPGYSPDRFMERVVTRFSPGFEDQNPGPVILALLPLSLLGCGVLLRTRWKSPLPWLMALHLAGGWFVWFFTYQSVRFLLIPLAIAGVAGVFSLYQLACGRMFRLLATGLLLSISLAGTAWFCAWMLFYKRYGSAEDSVYPVAAATGLIGEERVLSSALGFYDAVAWLNVEAKDGESVLYIGEFRGLYARYEAVLSDWFDTPRILTELRASENNETMIRAWHERGIRYVLYNRAELSLYALAYFKPRMSDEEWRRFQVLDEALTRQEVIVFETDSGTLIVDLEEL